MDDKKSLPSVVRISQRFHFNAAHRLPAVPENHPCARMHGHNYLMEVELQGAVDPDFGWLKDYGELKRIVAPTIERLDHRCLNDVDGLYHTTAEELAVWIWNQIQPRLPQLLRVTIWETPNSRCDYFGPDFMSHRPLRSNKRKI